MGQVYLEAGRTFFGILRAEKWVVVEWRFYWGYLSFGVFLW
jgi:hypothetical protein